SSQFRAVNSALAVVESSRAWMIGCTVEGIRGSAVYATTKSEAYLTETSVTGTDTVGVYATGPGTKVILDQCQVARSGGPHESVQADDQASITLTHTRVSDSESYAVTVDNDAEVTLQDCDVARAAKGLLMVAGGRATLHDVRLEAKDLDAAVAVQGKGAAT